ncbi:PAS domain S-box-containing protein [Mucilaginibacter mallensis]|uniref:histidine kinase n=1 Tax=Mucilaginibacter mallensis TaxID=652787 RepID=A0A1H2AJK8_MUCMA|nr:PAS domain-containing protein [Mucilaginibacter mallensis]SDT46054.1 PAS domain S-box-containing protein [Mucilaginibacter mallensis]
MLGWVFHIPVIQHIPMLAVLKFNSGLCFFLFSSALLLFQYKPSPYNTLSFFLLSLFGTAIGLITLLQFIFHFNTGIDQLFVGYRSTPTYLNPFPGRMAFNSAVNFSLLGLGMLGLTANKHVLNIISQYIFHLVSIISVIVLIGLLYGASLFYTLFYVTSMPALTAVFFLILSVEASLLNPSLGITRLFTGKRIGNQMARRLFSLIILMIIVFGSLKVQTERSQIFSSVNIGLSILSICFLLVSLALVWNTAIWLNKIDKLRYEAETEVKLMNTELEKRVEERSAEFKKSEEKYHSLIEQASDAIYILDDNNNFTDVNASMCKMTGYNREELLSLNILAILDPEEQNIDPIPKSIAGLKQVIRERRFIKKDGHAFTVEINVKIFSDDRVMVIARDITARKKIEAELRDAELRFRTIADKSMVGVYIVQKGKFTYVNPRFAEIFGYQPEELMNTVPVETIVDEEYRAIATENVNRRMLGEVESVNYEARGKKRDGTGNWVEFYGSRAIIGGEPTIIGSMIDITKRKKAEEELRSSELKYKLLFESNPMPMWMIAKDDLSIIDANQAAIKHYGYTKDELLQMSVRSMRPKEDEEIQLEGYLKEMDLDSAHRIVRHLKKDGSVMYIQLISHDIIYDGRPVRLSLTNNITERLKAEESLQKSEANLQTILKTTDTAYALFDQDLKVLTFNYKAAEFVKAQLNQVAAKGNMLTDYFPEDKFPRLNKFAHEALLGHNVNYEIDYPQPDGSVMWYYVRLFPITNDNKEILGMLMGLYDITERKNAEQDLKSAYKRIQNHMDSIKDMAWKQSHLIRSPLANLKGLTSILKTDNSDITVLEHIQTELDRMDAIIIQMAEDASNHDDE